MMRNAKADPVFPPPWVDGWLPNLEGGAQNVIPLELLDAPLRVYVAPWPASNPTPGTPETLMLMWDGEQVGALREWTAPIAPDDYYVDIPMLHLRVDATPELTYRVKAYNEAEGDSHPVTITLDLTGPRLGGDRGGLVFDDEVLAGGITQGYLENHDSVVATVPAYQTFVPGDRIRWFWDKTLYEYNLVAEKVLKQEDFPVTVEFSRDVILDCGNGPRFAHYLLGDYAGNPSTPEEPKVIQLEVDATPVPRDLSWPEVSHATGDAQQVELDPNQRITYMRVKVPAGAALPGETITVFWGEPGTVGCYEATEEAAGYPGEYEIPLHRIAPYSGKQLKVYFEVTEKAGGIAHPSADRLVSCLALHSGSFFRPDVAPRTADTVHLSQVPADGLSVILAPWRFIHTDHRVTLVVGGTDPQGGALSQEVLTQHAMTPAEVEKGLGVEPEIKATKPFLLSLARNKISVKVFVSFDQGHTWPTAPNFPSLELDLRD